MERTERYIPKAILSRMAKRTLKESTEGRWVITDEFVDTLHECVLEFIDIVALEAAHIVSNRKKPKTMMSEDVVKSLRKLEFQDCATNAITEVAIAKRIDDECKRKRKKARLSTLTREQLLAKQNEMLEKAAQALEEG